MSFHVNGNEQTCHLNTQAILYQFIAGFGLFIVLANCEINIEYRQPHPWNVNLLTNMRKIKAIEIKVKPHGVDDYIITYSKKSYSHHKPFVMTRPLSDENMILLTFWKSFSDPTEAPCKPTL